MVGLQRGDDAVERRVGELRHNEAMTSKPLDLGVLDAAIVDLDGTMVDTVGDFEEALNRTLGVSMVTVQGGKIPEYHIVPDRSRYLEYEPHRVLDVHAHFPAAW